MDAITFINMAKDAVDTLISIIMDPTNKFTKEQIAKITPKTNGIMGTISQMAVKMASLEGELATYKNISHNNESSSKSCTNSIDILDAIAEMDERKSRSHNIIMHNVKESTADTLSQKLVDDTNKVTKVLNDIDNSVQAGIVKLYRLGKARDNKPRPIKIEFNAPSIPKILLSKRRMFKENVRIYQDLTPNQQKRLKDLYVELDTRTKEGETDLIIKYFNSVPRIVLKSKNYQNSN